ncbi:unnamed protein product [Tilletia controversa]|uniref:Thioesterase domain-containing protein n=3 Tax=Tilletia TaxID=13289 RepID=A0A8X7MY67_9BASI|nr:hypothetical protein CF336_g2228 [Tilletia laevis]KAE8204069.1 hypothetical protein CF328_g1299 [Tilletia controversa]KAE8263433.1 hypothetical protein A4X03_0g1684 [Tilletia caries]KAE8206896.1 hypothetical protein CF335_g1542 [Tilletia laevis]KAE8253257.1 hypothetical protein A4X06_0g1589 [Tilletia controversa]
MVPPPLRKYPYILPIQSRWPDSDFYHHINNVQYYIYADTCINTFLIANCGLEPANPTASPIGLMIASSCSFYAPLHFPSVIQTGLCVRKMGTSSVEYEIGIWEEPKEGKEGVLAAVVRCTHVFVDRETRVPMGKGANGGKGLPEEMRKGLEKLVVKEERESRL